MPLWNERTPLRVAALALATCTLPLAHAQVAGEIRGRVLDVTGGAVAGAHVTLTQTATGIQQSAASSADGLYDFPQLVSGTYSLHVESAGFATYDRRGITIATGSTVGLDAALAAAGSDAVTVNADAPLLQSQSSNIATTIASGTVQALPLNTRNFIQLAQLAPGVALPPGTLLPRRVRPLQRRRGQRGHTQRIEPGAWQPVRVLP
jgi:hypothetical protein